MITTKRFLVESKEPKIIAQTAKPIGHRHHAGAIVSHVVMSLVPHLGIVLSLAGADLDLVVVPFVRMVHCSVIKPFGPF